MRRLQHNVGALISVGLFGLALWVLHHELKAYHYHEVISQFRAIPPHRLLAGVGLMVASYLLLTAYDTLALRYIRHPLAFHRIALGSFIGYVFSHNATVLGGTAARYRIYSAWGISAIETSKVVLFCGMTLWIGFLSVGGVLFLVHPVAIPVELKLPLGSARPLGVIFLVLVAGYLIWAAARDKPIRIRQFEFAPPSPGVCVLQIVVSSLDWGLAAGVLYAVLPAMDSLSFSTFLATFLLAQGAGLVSHVPGALGVLETVVLLLLPSGASTPAVLGALLAYRVIYYLIPFAIALLLLCGHEVVRRGASLAGLGGRLGDRPADMVPSVLSFGVLLGGAVLLFSGATPAVKARLAWLEGFLPLAVVEASHFLASLAGISLVLVARGLQRRISGAYTLSAALLGAGVALSLLKGWDYEEAVVLAVVLAALLPCRRYFRRKASILSQPYGPGWVVAIVVVVLTSLWLGAFSHKHVAYSDGLWWQFTYAGETSRFLRAAVPMLALLCVFLAARLLGGRPVAPTLASSAELARIRGIRSVSGSRMGHLVFLGDKSVLFGDGGRAFIMYGVQGRSWIALGDPVGEEREWSELIWRYHDLCDRHGGRCVFYQVGGAHLDLYLDIGLVSLEIGEAARVPLGEASLEGKLDGAVCRGRDQAVEAGCKMEVVPTWQVAPLLPQLRAVSDAWLDAKQAREKAFSIGRFDEEYLRNGSVSIVRQQGQIVAFAGFWPVAEGQDLSIDLVRYVPTAPDGVMDYLLAALLLWGRQEGYRWLDLGLTPLPDGQDRSLDGLWQDASIAELGEHFDSPEDVRRYKERFDPVWQPVYVVCPGGLHAGQALADIAALVFGRDERSLSE